MKHSAIIFCFVLVLLPLKSFADGPKMPFIQNEICEGESGLSRCALFRKGIFQSPEPLKVFAKPLDKKPVAAIPAKASFQALTWALYTVETQACEILDAGGLMAEFQLKKGEKFYPLSYEGEGWVKVWYQGKPGSFNMIDEKSYRCPKSFPGYHGANKRSEYWTKMKYKGKIFWWPTPEDCSNTGCDYEHWCVYKCGPKD